MDPKTPLNGTRTHPLSSHALGVLRELQKGVAPTQTINPGVIDRLTREDLIEIVLMPSQYQTHRGKNIRIRYARITTAGIRRLSQG